MPTDLVKGMGIGIFIALGLEYILGRIPVISAYAFWLALALAIYLTFFIKK